MQIEIPKELSRKLEQTSKRLGVKKEMKDWDFLSDEALASFEKAL